MEVVEVSPVPSVLDTPPPSPSTPEDSEPGGREPGRYCEACGSMAEGRERKCKACGTRGAWERVG